MPIGKSSISRVAEGALGENAAPLSVDTPATEVEVKTVTAIAETPATPEKGDAPATTVEKTIVKGAAKKKPAAKKTTAKKPAAKKATPKKPTAKKAEAEEKKAPELVGQAAAATPAPKKRGRKPGSKNKPAAAPVVAPHAVSAPGAVAIGEDLPIYLL